VQQQVPPLVLLQAAQMDQDSHKLPEQEHQLFCIYWLLRFVTCKVGNCQPYRRALL
jgi:hypothetical protein